MTLNQVKQRKRDSFMQNTFKAGDKVYCPKFGKEVYTLHSQNNVNYPLYLMTKESSTTVTYEGREYISDGFGCIFHATEKNQQLLSDLYGVQFADPATAKASKDVIKAMLEDKYTFVPCYVSDSSETPDEGNSTAFIAGVEGKQYRDESDTGWIYATPIDIETGKVIIDFVDGKVVTA